VKYLLDTHAWIWAANGDRRLPSRLVRILGSAERDDLGLLDLSLWEAGRVHRAGELTTGDPLEWFAQALSAVTLVSLAADIVLAEQGLAWTHRDPVDRLVVATAMVRGLRVVTVDKTIRTSGLVQLA
jgi:PIN domain nuclease of toxin-antitoxin system